MLHPAVFNTSEICHALGVRHAVMSPGSRNAPLTVSFARQEKIKKWIIPDERSAGFIALGIAQMTQEPVVLCCTSGTALLNYAPAIAEAFYREIPLIVLSADRPPELIDQRDGQTIRQFEVLKNHVKASVQLPILSSDENSTNYTQLLISAIRQSEMLPKGPVHINIPFAEPFYPAPGQALTFAPVTLSPLNAEPVPRITSSKIDPTAYSRILILTGQQQPNEALNKALAPVSEKIPVLLSPLNNLRVPGIRHADLFVKPTPDLAPDLLITTGLSVLSKKIKNFIRACQPQAHWHFDPAGVAVDTYGTKPLLIRQSLEEFLAAHTFENADPEFIKTWRSYDREAQGTVRGYLKDAEWSETKAFVQISGAIPDKVHVHLGNSMPVRYADIFAAVGKNTYWCNRGTSGIDGCSSTAVGSTLADANLHVLLSGDVSFLYDRNAFFHNYPLPNLRVVVFNNSGGGIFRLIDGPSRLPELEDYFETRHKRTCEWVCAENRMDYSPAHTPEDLKAALTSFFEPSAHARLLEVFVEPEANTRAYKALRARFA